MDAVLCIHQEKSRKAMQNLYLYDAKKDHGNFLLSVNCQLFVIS